MHHEQFPVYETHIDLHTVRPQFQRAANGAQRIFRLMPARAAVTDAEKSAHERQHPTSNRFDKLKVLSLSKDAQHPYEFIVLSSQCSVVIRITENRALSTDWMLNVMLGVGCSPFLNGPHPHLPASSPALR